jgi:hypothetical protein
MIEGNTNTPSAANEHFSVFVYGQGGAGKTHFCSTFPKPYLVVTERVPRALELSGRDIPYVKVDTFDELQMVLNQILQGQRAQGCESVCLDSLSDMTPLVCEYVLRKVNKDKMTLQEWGLAVDYLRSFVRRFTLDLTKKVYVCMTALATVQKDELTGEIIGIPETIGRFAHVVPAMFDIVAFAKQDMVFNQELKHSEPRHILYTVAHGRYPAKDGIGFMNPEEPNDMAVLLTKYAAKKAS